MVNRAASVFDAEERDELGRSTPLELLTELMRVQGRSWTWLAAHLGIHPTTLGNALRDRSRSRLSDEQKRTIATLLGVPGRWIWTDLVQGAVRLPVLPLFFPPTSSADSLDQNDAADIAWR